MPPSTLILLALSVLGRTEAQRAAERIRQAQYCAAVERRAEHREVERVRPEVTVDVKAARDISDNERRKSATLSTGWRAARRVGWSTPKPAGCWVPEQRGLPMRHTSEEAITSPPAQNAGSGWRSRSKSSEP